MSLNIPNMKAPMATIRMVIELTRSFSNSSRSFLVARSLENSVKTSTCASTCGSVKPALARVLATLWVLNAIPVMAVYSLFSTSIADESINHGSF